MNFGNFDLKKVIDGKENLRKICETEGHVSSRGVVSIREGNLIIWDKCKICNTYYNRKPTESEFEKYKSLLR